MQLTDLGIKKLTKSGRHTDDMTKGLHLWVKPSQQKYWIFRYTIAGKREGISLGVYPEISLRRARELAIEARSKVNRGISPIRERKELQDKHAKKDTQNFESFALQYIETMRPKWRNQKHGDQWVNTIKTYAFPEIGAMSLDAIDTHHILDVLNPIWLTKAETASRLRGRIEKILSAATTLKLREGINPAVWKGHLENLLPNQPTSHGHHEALPYAEMPLFMAHLRDMESLSAMALEFTILNASRTGEVIRAKRSEVNSGIWTIPANRMKSGRQHQIPLTQRALEILVVAQHMDPESTYLFSKNGKPLSNMAMLMLVRRFKSSLTVHGFRSTFRDWISEQTDHSHEVAEMALAHCIGNRVEQAYRRGNLLERRRRLMNDWASYCFSNSPRLEGLPQ